MIGFYYIVNGIKEFLKSTDMIKTVTIGDISKIDLDKQTIFPLVHITPNNAQLQENLVILNVSVFFMDIVDESKTESINSFDGNDNELDVLNTQLHLANRLVVEMMRGQMYSEQIQILGTPNAEPFTERFTNNLAGWTVTFDVQIPNDMTIC